MDPYSIKGDLDKIKEEMTLMNQPKEEGKENEGEEQKVEEEGKVEGNKVDFSKWTFNPASEKKEQVEGNDEEK